VSEQSRLDIGHRQGSAQQRVVAQVDLADGEVVVGSPPRIERRDSTVVQARQSVLVEQGVLEEAHVGSLVKGHAASLGEDRPGRERPKVPTQG
jgi:hypothetical protein